MPGADASGVFFAEENSFYTCRSAMWRTMYSICEISVDKDMKKWYYKG